MKYLLPALLLLTALRVQAEPVTFQQVTAWQNNGFTKIDLLNTPAAVLETTSGDRLEIAVHTLGLLSDDPSLHTLRFTLDRNNTVDVFDRELYWPGTPCCNNFIEGAWFTFTDLPYRLPDGSAPSGATLYKLNVQIVGGQIDPNTYTFYVVKPIPEPVSGLLLLTGLGALLLKKLVDR